MSDQLQTAIDERLAAALEFANYRSTLNRQKENAKLKLQNALTYSKNGGIFAITPELISFVYALIASGKKKSILLDVNQNAIPIDDLKDFHDNSMTVYYTAMNDYIVECQSFKQARSVKSLIGV